MRQRHSGGLRNRLVRPYWSANATIVRAFTVIIASAATCAAAGAGIGYALARAAPSYYRSVFSGGDSPGFDPVQVGVGLGLSQGAIAGLLVGSVVVLAVALSGSRRPRKEPLDLS